MTASNATKSFVTPRRIALARNLANEFAECDVRLSAPAAAEKAVRRVFGRWLLDPTAAVRPEYLPLYYQLIAKVESQMGLHRAPKRSARPTAPWSRPAAAMPVGLMTASTAPAPVIAA
jgi:hypothetical protein